MILSDRDLAAEIESGALVVDPAGAVQPASIDLSLGGQFRKLYHDLGRPIDPTQPGREPTRLIEPEPGQPLLLRPGEFLLGTTVERVQIPAHLAARLEGRSTLGRLGLLVHSTAGFIDPGFQGHITLELVNVAGRSIRLWPGMPCGQLCLLRMTSPAQRPYGSAGLGSRYQDQAGPTAARPSI